MPGRRGSERTAPVAERGERKVVSVLFADLAGFTALAASMDPEDVYRFLHPAMSALRAIVEDFGGTVPQVMGDGFMAVFGVPAVHEDDAERAVRAALAVRDHVRELNAAGEGIRVPEVHAGVNTGEVMVAPADEQSGFSVIGDTVNTASRLADLAPAGRVLVDERTRAVTAGAIRYSSRRIRHAKGKPGLATHEALGLRAAPRKGRAGRLRARAFVDREAMMDRLLGEAAAVERDGTSRVLVVTGQPGQGKSRAGAELGKRLRRGSVLVGRCVPFAQRLPLHALAEAVGGLLGVPPGGSQQEIDSASKALADRLPGTDHGTLVRGMSLLLAGRVPAGQAPGSVRDALQGARTVVEGLARTKAPVTVVLDDLQWGDPDLVDVLENVVRRPWDSPVLFLGLSRPGGPVADLPGLMLEALPESAMLEMAGDVLGEDPPLEVAEAAVSRAAGNPLFLEESLGMLVETGALVEGVGGWHVAEPDRLRDVPSTIRSLIAARLDALPPEEKHVLQDASVAGDATWDALVAHVSEIPQPGRVLLSLERRDILWRHETSSVAGAVEYGFKHPLIREVAYESLPRVERVRRHLQTAEWLRRRERSGTDLPVAVLAHHYERAWELERSAKGQRPSRTTARAAVEYLGRWAEETFAYQARAAGTLFERALRVARQAGEGIDPRVTAGLLTDRAESLIEMGQRREAISDATEARDMARRLGDRRSLARASLAIGRAESDSGNMPEARTLLRRARREFRVLGDMRGEGWALHRLSETWSRDDFRRELADLREAHRLFARSRDRRGRSVAAQDLAYLLTTQGGPEFHRWLKEAERVAEDDRDLRSRAAVARTRGYFAYFCAEYEEAIRIMGEAGPIAAQAGDRYAEADAVLIAAMSAAAVGSPEEAERLSGDALRLADELDSARVRALGLLAGARAAIRAGSPPLAAARLKAARRVIEQRGITVMRSESVLFDAWVALDRGGFDVVPGLVVELGAAIRSSGWQILRPLVPLLRGRASLGAGLHRAAVRDLDRAAGLARSLGTTGSLALAQALGEQSRLLLGEAARVIPVEARRGREIGAVCMENDGLKALVNGDDQGAAGAFERATDTWRAMGRTVWLARSLSLQAGQADREGRDVQARSFRREANGILADLKTPARDRRPILSPLQGSRLRPVGRSG
jgi:class 3 adenylate cyclase/tetratricopeptide (TPR) repeat protein